MSEEGRTDLPVRNERIEIMERVKGIEPSSEAWEAPALPLSYTRAAKIISDPLPSASAPRRRKQSQCRM